MVDLAPSRWLAIIKYRKGDGILPVPFDIEELSELEEIVERGPDWNTIDKIEITLQRPSGAGKDSKLALDEVSLG